MSLPNPYAQYRQNSVETASPTRLIVMLYDGAIRFLSQGLAAMQAGQHVQQSILIGKAQAIVAHLHDTLDPETGSDFAQSLLNVYTALLATLTQANVEDSPKPVENAIEVLRELRETWAEVDRQCRSDQSRALAAA